MLVPRAGGVLSALGLAISRRPPRLRRARCSATLDGIDRDAVEETFARLEEQRAELDARRCAARADLRYRGQSFELTVPADDLDDARRALPRRRTSAATATAMDDEPVELVTLRVDRDASTVEKPELAARSPARRDAERGERAAQLRRRVGARPPSTTATRSGAGVERRGPGDRRVRRGDLRRAARAGRARSTTPATLVLERE